MKRLLAICVVVLPWKIKRWVLRRFWGYQIADGASIGLAYVFPGELVMHEGARIDHFTVAIHLDRMECGAHSYIGRSNWVTGHPRHGEHFRHRAGRDPTLFLGDHSAITKQHIIDCTDRIEIGAFTTVAGYGSQLITHGIDAFENRQDCKPIRIGAYCLVGTRVTVLGGAVLPDCTVLGAGSLLNKVHIEEYAVYAGQPAKKVKDLDPEAAYFHRQRGFVH